jgi:signal recognition particle subunit SRP19
MKDYDHIILWLDYFNKALSRKEGRRVSKGLAVFEPTIEELVRAAKAVGYNDVETNIEAKHPKRWYKKSGYIMILKDNNKESIIKEIAKEILRNRKR